MRKTTLGQLAIDLAHHTNDAYSFDSYVDWRFIAMFLLKRGYTAIEAEAIMRSKWMRWAADRSTNKYGQNEVDDLRRWLDEFFKEKGGRKAEYNAVRQLVNVLLR